MQKIKELKSPLCVISFVADIVVLSYIFLYFYWMFGVENMDTHILTDVFARLNPMTWGTYLLGVVLLIHLVAFKNIIGRCLMTVLYCFSVVVSLIAIMGMTSWSDLAIYLPHVVIIVLAIVILIKQNKQAIENDVIDKETKDAPFKGELK